MASSFKYTLRITKNNGRIFIVDIPARSFQDACLAKRTHQVRKSVKKVEVRREAIIMYAQQQSPVYQQSTSYGTSTSSTYRVDRGY